MNVDPAKPLPGQESERDAIVSAPLAGTRAQSIQRLQVGLTGLLAMVLMVGLANIVIISAQQNRAEVVPESVTEVPSDDAAADAPRNPLADAGVVPDMPAEASPPERIEPLDPAILGDSLEPAR